MTVYELIQHIKLYTNKVTRQKAPIPVGEQHSEPNAHPDVNVLTLSCVKLMCSVQLWR